MLEPREADVPALFLVLVVLPLVTYFLLGKWSEASKRKERIVLLAQLAAEESLREEVMAVASVSPPPVVSPPKAVLHECARCHAPATTRCSRCKSVRYCSGRCQIIHWRKIHKDECQPSEIICSSFQHVSPREPVHGKLFNENLSGQFVDSPLKQPVEDKTFSNVTSINHGSPTACASVVMDSSKMPEHGRKSTEKKVSCITSREVLGREETSASCSTDDISGNGASSKEIRNKLKINDTLNPGDGVSERHKFSSNKISSGEKTASKEQASVGAEGELGSNYRYSGASHHMEIGMTVDKVVARKSSVDYRSFCKEGVNSNGEAPGRKSFSDILPNGGSSRSKSTYHSETVKILKSYKPVAKSSKEQVHNTKERKGHVSEELVARVGDAYRAQGANGINNTGCIKMMSLKKSPKTSRRDASEVIDDHKTVKMLFPYEEFVKFFQCEITDLTPRGLSNCGNSCYANAVLQCLTCTKPLVVYLLKRTHSRSCRVRSWCLMCELEQYVQMLRESGGPLSPSRILSHMRSMNCPMGDGSQEDAHEFLRLLVASMQSTCLEECGGEKSVHPLLQETTFVQHTFGGRLRSRVKCLNCHLQSERCENFMDLTLEIFGWVESLEDALTQFTSPEDLDGENMYKCGRCASYVQARKQLSIDEAPNILTIVLKRFQEGSYGKINKCITFPEMLDMIPFMTGPYDVPPLYMLYGVVVHMDTLNASFSGHYVSYVKDVHGNWLRIDDSVVQPVPMSQVMSEGAYILFYMRSYPRPSHAICQQIDSSEKTQKSSRSKAGRSECSSVVYNSHTLKNVLHNANNHQSFSIPYTLKETYAGGSMGLDFPDATSSSDRSLFTSSDEAASFTTESTRDSFSTTAEYADVIPDTVNSFFNSLYAQEHASSQKTVSCRMFSGSKPLTGFVHKVKGYVVDSCDYDSNMSTDPPNAVWPGGSYVQTTPNVVWPARCCMRTSAMTGGDYGGNPCDFARYGCSFDGYYYPTCGHLWTNHRH